MSGALGLVGGVPGLVMLGAAAWYTLYQNQEQAREIQAEQENDMNILKKLMQRLCGCGKHDGREHVQSLTAQLRLGPADILESDENGIIPEQDRVITQVVILDADKKQIQCVVRPLQILRADGRWENIGGMK
ncbi:phage tail protein [Escherichia coli]|nr:phage tail protein [Escherichia coli]EFJ9692837.1 phage tail protein [Escherichia coli]